MLNPGDLPEESSIPTQPSPRAATEVARMPARSDVLLPITVLLVTLVAAGCVGLSEGEPRQEGTPVATFSYDAEGPIYLAGFWPAAGGDRIVADDETTVTVTLQPGGEVLDAAGEPVAVLNVTYRAEGHRATHAVHAGTGSIVAVEQPTELGRSWRWTASGAPGLLGGFDRFVEQGPPERWTVACCTAPRALANSTEEDLALSLVEAHGNVESVVEATEHEAWAPPEPRDLPRYDLPQHHSPTGEAYEPDLPLDEALEEARENCPQARQYMDAHPSWKAVYAALVRNPGQAPVATEERRWILLLEAEEATTHQVVLRYQQPTGPGGSLEEGVATCETSEFEDLDRWTEVPRGLHATGYTEGWALARHVAAPDTVSSEATYVVPRAGGPVLGAALAFDPYESPEQGLDKELRTVGIDLETGLLDAYSGRDPPREVLERSIPGSMPEPPTRYEDDRDPPSGDTVQRDGEIWPLETPTRRSVEAGG
jgi:hypothetical protein